MYASFLNAQIGQLIWQEDFNDLNGWIIETGNGSWGWGNGELEFYQGSNVFIDSVPGEAGNNALHIVARQESGANIVDQWGNPLDYTSGRINSKSEVSMQFGMVETRVRIPNLDLGGWPAFWLLGTSNYSWPRCGELDMMEMGHKKAVRDQHDTHNGGSGQNNSTVNQMVASNAMFYDAGSINTGNPLGAASTGHIYVWEGTLAAGSEAPHEGPNGISWTSTGAGWFGAGIMSVQPLNLSAYEQGNLHFSVKIPANVDFQVGIIDAWGNQSWVEFPANQTKYGLQRDGQWGQATIPVSDIRGTLIDLRMLSYPFAVLEVNGAFASIALDDIYWSGGSMNIADSQAAGLRSLKAFPNPSVGELTLRWTQQVAGRVQWEVRNSAGALVMLEQEDLVPSGEREMTLDASEWAEGVYFVTRTDLGSQETLRLVLTK